MIIPSTTIELNKNEPINGIFRYIQNYLNIEDFCDSKYVNVNVQGTNSNKKPQTPLINKELANDASWGSTDTDDEFYEMDFIENKVIVTNFTYRAHSQDFFNEWYLKGSNDKNNYEIIHQELNFDKPNELIPTLFFESQNYKPFRYIRLIPKGERFYYNLKKTIYLYNFELFGSFISYVDLINKYRKTKQLYNNFMLYLISFLFICII